MLALTPNLQVDSCREVQQAVVLKERQVETYIKVETLEFREDSEKF